MLRTLTGTGIFYQSDSLLKMKMSDVAMSPCTCQSARILVVEQIWDHLIRAALREDLEAGDLTSELLFPSDARAMASVYAREEGILSGLDLAQRVFELLDETVEFQPLKADGDWIDSDEAVARITARVRKLLAGERLALNLLMRLSGIATATYRLQSRLREKGLSARITDTRKTTPLWRFAEKKAVRHGGGVNHRMNLGDSILIKDNHISLFGSAAEAVRRIRAQARHMDRIEVEVESIGQIEPLLNAGADIILLDNFTPEQVREAVRLIGDRAVIEVSGGVTPENIDDYAIEGVDVISLGWLTHSAPAINFSMEILPEVRG